MSRTKVVLLFSAAAAVVAAAIVTLILLRPREEPETVTAEEIERRFLHPSVIVTRPLILGGLALLRVACRFGWTAEGADRLDPDDQPFILAANHCSHADTAAILGTLPRSIAVATVPIDRMVPDVPITRSKPAATICFA